LRNVKGAQHVSLFSFSDVGPLQAAAPTGCSYDPDHDPTTDLYMVNAFNGVSEDICTADWSMALQNVGKIAFGYRTHFYLTGEPDLTGGNMVTVTRNGMPLGSVDSNGTPVWSYDPVTNSVVFQPLFVPGAGDVMTVTYRVACLQ
jgi:hypothetical protein